LDIVRLFKQILSTLPAATEEMLRKISKHVLEAGNYEYYGIVIVIILVIIFNLKIFQCGTYSESKPCPRQTSKYIAILFLSVIMV